LNGATGETEKKPDFESPLFTQSVKGKITDKNLICPPLLA